jgi:hypothetical protein
MDDVMDRGIPSKPILREMLVPVNNELLLAVATKPPWAG